MDYNRADHADSILDRKIERRALPTSFSSNLGRKRPSPSKTMSGRSVRAMISLFEGSSGALGSPEASRARVGTDMATKVDRIDERFDFRGSHDNNNAMNRTATWPWDSQSHSSQLGSSILARPPAFFSAPVDYVEEYSLTLLKHKSYLNNRPLARCLDEYHEQEDRKKTMEKERQGKGSVTENREHQGGGDHHGGTGRCRRKRNDTSSPIQQLDDLMNELLALQDLAEPSTSGQQEEREERNPEEAEEFWTDVRTQLWIDDDEIYGATSDSSRKGGRHDTPKGKNDHDWKQSTSAGSLARSPDPAQEPITPPCPGWLPPPVPEPACARAPSSDYSRESRRHSAASSVEYFPDPAPDYPLWGQPSPPESPALGTFVPRTLTIFDIHADMYPEPELPASSRAAPAERHAAPARQPSLPAADNNNNNNKHSRYPSGNSSGSGRWTRPPTWRCPFARTSPLPSSPFPTPPPAAAPRQRGNGGGHDRYRHQRHHHQQHHSRTSTCTAASSAGGSGSGNVSVCVSSARRSSTATRSTRAGSSTDLSRAKPQHSAGVAKGRRRLTTEEKLSEIDAFLLSPGKKG